MTSQSASADLDQLLPIALIRQHTKTDDVPHVTDEMLALYREAAFDAAAVYTGRTWGGPSIITQVIDEATVNALANGVTRVRLKGPTADGIITVTSGGSSYVMAVAPGATMVEFGGQPTDYPAEMGIDAVNCCTPCGGSITQGTSLTYRTGQKGGAAIPPMIKLGILQYIAWAMANAGDATVNYAGQGSVALESGAHLLWWRHRGVMAF